jgi:hypothetical protein
VADVHHPRFARAGGVSELWFHYSWPPLLVSLCGRTAQFERRFDDAIGEVYLSGNPPTNGELTKLHTDVSVTNQ